MSGGWPNRVDLFAVEARKRIRGEKNGVSELNHRQIPRIVLDD
jgi:hypothetical protein